MQAFLGNSQQHQAPAYLSCPIHHRQTAGRKAPACAEASGSWSDTRFLTTFSPTGRQYRPTAAPHAHATFLGDGEPRRSDFGGFMGVDTTRFPDLETSGGQNGEVEQRIGKTCSKNTLNLGA